MAKRTRKEVYAAIDSEREYQNVQWSEHGDPTNPLTIGEFILLLEQYTEFARTQWTHEKKPEHQTLHFIRKVAGIAVNCMEQHGVPHRPKDSV